MVTKKKAVKPTKDIDDVSLEVWQELNANKYEHFIKAINSGCLTEHAGRIESYMKHGDTSRLGTLIMNAVITKVESWANDEIAKRFNNGLSADHEA